MGLPEGKTIFTQFTLLAAELCLPSGLGSLKELCISPSLWVLKGKAGFPQSGLLEADLCLPSNLGSSCQGCVSPRFWSPRRSTVLPFTEVPQGQGCFLSLGFLHVGSVAQLCPTLCNTMVCSQPGSSVHGIYKARILVLVTIIYSTGSSQPRD